MMIPIRVEQWCRLFLFAGGFLGCLCLFPTSAKPASQTAIALPKPDTTGSLPLENTLWQRKSARSFKDKVPTWEEIGQLLWAAQGINRPEKQGRTAPSAWATYPLEMYVVRPDGVYHYRPTDHVVVQVKTGDIRNQLAKTGLTQSVLHKAPCVFIFCADFARMIPKCETLDDALRYVYLEAGHAAQNLLLQLVSLKMAGCPIGANIVAAGQNVLGIPDPQKPVYILVAGFPKDK